MQTPEPIAFAYCTEFGIGNPLGSTQGTALTNALGASNADGAAAVQIGSGSLTHDCELLEVIVTDCTGDATGVDSSALLDILIDPAGGTSWDTTNRLITSLQVGFHTVVANDGKTSWRKWTFPLWVKSGASFAGIGRSVIAAAQTCNVFLRCYGGVNKPNQWWCGQKCDSLGEDRANSTGTSVTPHATLNTWGTDTSIGSTTARRYGYLLPTFMAKSNNVTNAYDQFQVRIGSQTVGGTYQISAASTEVATFMEGSPSGIFCDIPEGTQIQARAKSSANSAVALSTIIHGVTA